MALSTFLLHHLPISKDDEDKEQISDKKTKPAIAYLSLPIDEASSCTVHAYLVRNSLNTVTAQLFTEMTVVNECPWEIELAEIVPGDDETEEALWEGKILAGEKQEKKAILEPLGKAVCVWKQVGLLCPSLLCQTRQKMSLEHVIYTYGIFNCLLYTVSSGYNKYFFF